VTADLWPLTPHPPRPSTPTPDTMSSRDTILQRVRTEVSKGPHVARPPVPEVWPRENPAPAMMAERFARELTDVHGEVIRCATIEEGRKKLAELVAQNQWTSLGAMDRPLVREAVAELPSGVVQWAAADWQPQPMAELSAAIVQPEALLADTGSCLIACATTQDRLLCYLPPACIVVARTAQLFEHLPAAWTTIAPRVADPALRGEFVIVTGPSRTADIEKILILGVHGPKRLVVLLVG
jgi:L-lactate dehydrogenase complex protein LldG